MKQYPVQRATLPNGETIAYREAGRGETALVLVHGNMSSSVHWEQTMAALEGQCRIIAPDLRGFGDSGYAAPFDSLAELAEDVAALLALLDVRACVAVGWSAGGGVAMELAAMHPDRVRRLVLINPVPPTGYPMFRKNAAGQPILTELLQTKEDVAGDPVQVAPMVAAQAAGNRDLMRIVWNATIYNLHQPPEAVYERELTAVLQQRCLVDLDYALLTFNITHRANGVRDGNGRIDLIRCPVYVLQGERDLVVPPAWTEQTVHDFGVRAEHITFVQAGHSLMVDAFEPFISTLTGIAVKPYL